VVPRAWGGSPNWLPDNHSFVYGKLQKLPPGAPFTEIEQKVRSYLHVLGTDGEKDPAVFGYGVVPSISVDPRNFAGVVAQPNSDYALGSINSGVSPNSAFYIEPVAGLGNTNSAWRKVADFSDDVSEIEVHGDDLYVLMYKNARRYKVIRIDARQPDLASAEIIVPPSLAVVTGINPAQDALYVRNCWTVASAACCASRTVLIPRWKKSPCLLRAALLSARIPAFRARCFFLPPGPRPSRFSPTILRRSGRPIRNFSPSALTIIPPMLSQWR